MGASFFSIGMIFKDEIRCLERCLKSLQPLRDAVPCELVMADTGSSDGSREIATKYADILFDFPWVDDFSAARNAVMDRCSGQWYFTIDADEWLTDDIAELIAFSKEKTLPHDFGAVNIHNYNTVELDENQQFNDFSGIRLLRMSTGIRYTGCIHEKWLSPDGESVKAMMLHNTWLNHDGYAYADKAAEQAKHDRNMALLRKKLAENPEDMQTYVECIDISKYDVESVEYARKLMEVFEKKPPYWDRFGPVVFRASVSAGKLQKMPELMKWAAQAVEMFPNSMFTRIDVAYYALADCWDRSDSAGSAYWGSMYKDALSEYRAGQYDHSELLRGALEYVSPYWERKVFVLLGQAYLDLDEPEKTLETLCAIDGKGIEELRQVESITHMMMRLHRTTRLDISPLLTTFWEQINQPVPSDSTAKARRNTFLNAAGAAFAKAYQDEEAILSDFVRHTYSLFSSLSNQCELGTAALILETEDPVQLEELLVEAKDLDLLPGSALSHALQRGVRFPLPDHPMPIEKMDTLVSAISKEKGALSALVSQAVEKDIPENTQELIWIRGLCIAALRTYDWKSNLLDAKEGLVIARMFARVERKYLPLCYAPGALEDPRLFLLPPMHRFGFYCAQAFDALDAGDAAGYVRLLREGLEVCEGVKDMVEFLLNGTPELKDPSDELKTMAEQIRAVLANFAPDDPAVAMLKQSEAYQKVAYLIEGLDVPVSGGLMQ